MDANTQYTFLTTYDHPWFLVGSPSDVSPERAAVASQINVSLESSGIVSHTYPTQVSDAGADQRSVMQATIGLPRPPLCRGVICIFGEKVGSPYDKNFPAEEYVPQLEVWTDPTADYRLIFPWPRDPKERIDALEAGGFPLTGTIFEFLTTWGQHSQDLPVLATFLTDREITPTNRDDIELNGSRWYDEETKDKPKPFVRRFLNGEYFEQTEALKNFACALSERSLARPCADGQASLLKITRNWLDERFQLDVGDDNPYRRWGTFGVDDVHLLHGRASVVNEAWQKLKAIWQNEAAPNALRITGSSGTGKSSLLQAGLLGRHMHDRERPTRVALLRPEHFGSPYDSPGLRLRSIVRSLLQQAKLTVPDLDRLEDTAPDEVAELAVRLVIEALGSLETGCRLLIGLDQFEEVVDQLHDKEAGKGWQPILDLINVAAMAKPIGVVYTLESARRKRLKSMKLGKAFEDAEEVELPMTDQFFEEVIRTPFQGRGYRLSEEVVSKLLENLDNYPLEHAGGMSKGSLLPLLSMRLHELFEQVKLIRRDKDRSKPVGLEDVRGHVGLDTIASKAANLAWRRAETGNPITLRSLDWILSPLVGTNGVRTESGRVIQLLLTNTPSHPPDRRIVDEMLRNRLLVPALAPDEGSSDSDFVQLSHEAVIRHWEPAKNWFECRAEDLVVRFQMRNLSKNWRAQGCPRVNEVTGQQVHDAVVILAMYYRSWALGEPTLTSDDALLRNYCLELFSHAERADLYARDAISERSYMMAAIGYRQFELLERFVSQDAECVNRTFGKRELRYPLEEAMWFGADVVQWLLDHGAEPMTRLSNSPVALTVFASGRVDVFDALMSSNKSFANAVRDEEFDWGYATPLLLAASRGHLDLCRLLLQSGARPDRRSNGGLPMHAAASSNAGDLALFQMLSVDVDIDVREKDEGGQTALHHAARSNNFDVVAFLLDLPLFREVVGLRCDRDIGQATALHYACGSQRPEVIGLLRKKASELNPNVPIDPREPLPNPFMPSDKKNQSVYRDPRRAIELAINSADPDTTLAAVQELLKYPELDLSRCSPEQDSPLELARSMPQVYELMKSDPRIESSSEGDRYRLLLRLAEGENWAELEREWVVLETREEDIRKLLQWKDTNEKRLLHHVMQPTVPAFLLHRILSHVGDADLLMPNKWGMTPLSLAANVPVADICEPILNRVSKNPIDIPSVHLPAVFYSLVASNLLSKLTAETRDQYAVHRKRLLKMAPGLFTETDEFGWTPLHYLCMAQQTKALREHAAGEHYDHDATLWHTADRYGVRPADLLRPEHRESLHEEGIVPVLGKTSSEMIDEGGAWDDGYNWKRLSHDEVKEWFAPLEDSKPSQPGTVADEATLPFYDESVRLLRLANPLWSKPQVRLYRLRYGSLILGLDGTSPPIHKMNAQRLSSGHEDEDDASVPRVLTLTPKNVIAYLKFFCFFVRGEEGPFYILESADESLPHFETGGEKLTNYAKPARFRGQRDDGTMFLTANIWYSNVVSMANFAVYPDGQIYMIDDVAIGELPAGTVYDLGLK